MRISGEASLKFNEEGMKLEVKNLNINNFCIDNVFKYIDKKHKKLMKKAEKNETREIAKESSNNDGMYVIEINV